jgi:5-methylcytosine-specific restriction endonuclease McrA
MTHSPPADRCYLQVPYAQKDAAKRLGARWDAVVRCWYVPAGLALAPFERWLPPSSLSPVPEISAPSGEPRLTIELVPQTCWFSNVRSEVSSADWTRLKHETFQSAHYQCEICGGRGPQHPVECHEVWQYDDENHCQTLIRLMALCPACHECKHIGFAHTRGRGPIAAKHLANVNGWTIEQTVAYIDECFAVWQQRSQWEWDLDIGYLAQLGIPLRDPARRGNR